MSSLLQDVRYAYRMLVKNPGFTVVALLTLALSIGANTAIFSLINATLLRPLPGVTNPDALVSFERVQAGQLLGDAGYPDYLDYRQRARSFSGIAAYRGAHVSLSERDSGERLESEVVSGNYFDVLGVRPALGRLLGPEDERGGSTALVISFHLWRRRFGSDSTVLGRTLHVNGHSFTVVGVAARPFHGPRLGSVTDLWLPVTAEPIVMPQMTPGTLQNRASGWLNVFGRLRPGVGIRQAQAEITAIAADLAREYPVTNLHRTFTLEPRIELYSDDRAALGHFLVLLLTSVCMVLLIACANVGSLLLARNESRRREVAVRLALGASRRRLLRQLLTEGLLLSLLAAALGLLLLAPAVKLMASMQGSGYGFENVDFSADRGVLMFALAVAVIAGVLFSLLPGLRASKTDLVASLKETRPSAGPGVSRWQGILVVAQVALSLALLSGAGLIAETLRSALTADPGFRTRNALLFSVDPGIQGYSEAQGKNLYSELLHQVGAIPGVRSVSTARTVPPDDYSTRVSIFYPGQVPPAEELQGREFELGIRVDSDLVGPDYFRTLDIPMARGRDFTAQDTEHSAPVAVINEKLAARLWPGDDPIGRYIVVPDFGAPVPPPMRIVGVTRDTKYRSLLVEPPLLLYLPATQHYNGRTTAVIVSTNGDPGSLQPEIRRRVTALDKSLPIFNVESMAQHVAESLWQQRVALELLGLFSVLGLFMAAVGLYGILAHGVARRTHEIGIRMALGAKPENVLALVVRHSLGLTLAGLLGGFAVALIVNRALASLVYGVHAVYTTVIIAAGLLVGAAFVASYIPARRATRVDPIAALRCE